MSQLVQPHLGVVRKVLQISRKFQRFLSVPSSNGQLHGFEAPPEEADPQLKKAWNAWYPLQGIDYGCVPTEITIAPFLAQLLGDNLVPETVFTLNHRINSNKCRVHEQAPGLACITSTLTTSFMSWHCRSGRQGGFLGLRARTLAPKTREWTWATGGIPFWPDSA